MTNNVQERMAELMEPIKRQIMMCDNREDLLMMACAMMNISEGIKNGRVQTIVVPANFNALMLQK